MTRGIRIGRVCAYVSAAPFSFGRLPRLWRTSMGGELGWGRYAIGWQVLPRRHA